jgi:ankyrin repeat protein
LPCLIKVLSYLKYRIILKKRAFLLFVTLIPAVPRKWLSFALCFEKMNIPSLTLSKYLTTSTEVESSHTNKLLPTPPTSPDTPDPATKAAATSAEGINSAASQQKRRLENPIPRTDEKLKIHRANKLDLNLLDIYLSSGKPINVKDQQYGLNLLCWACQCRSLDAVKKILQQGVIDINQRHGPHQMTALHIAAAVDFASGIDCLALDPNLDLNQKDAFGSTALHYAARSNHYASISVLLDAGARLDVYDKKNKLALHYAIQHANLPLISLVLSKRERNNPSLTNLVWFSPENGNNVIEETIVNTGNSLILSQLLQSGAFLPTSSGGWWEEVYRMKRDVLIDLCIHWNRFDCLKCLVEEAQISKEISSRMSQHALILAVHQRKMDFVSYLCKQVQVNPCDSNGNNPSLLYAANHGFMEMIPFLITPETSLDCIQQAMLFSRMIGKSKMLGDLVRVYWKPYNNLSSHASVNNNIIPTEYENVDTANHAVYNIFESINNKK